LDIVPLSKKFRKYAEALYKILFEHFYRLGVSACVSVAVSLDIKGQDWDPVANESGRRNDAFCQRHRAHVSEVSDDSCLWGEVPSRQGCQVQVVINMAGIVPVRKSGKLVTFLNAPTIPADVGRKGLTRLAGDTAVELGVVRE
jgi:hypothetical protein